MNIRPASDRAERSMRVLLFLALMLGVGWAMADRGETQAVATATGAPGR